jgi:hypothetical protein
LAEHGVISQSALDGIGKEREGRQEWGSRRRSWSILSGIWLSGGMKRCVDMHAFMTSANIQPLRRAFGEHANTQLYFADTRIDKDVSPILDHAVSEYMAYFN